MGHLMGGALLDDPPSIHHRNPVGDRTDDRQVVRDVQKRQPGLVGKAPDLSQQSLLNDDVETGRGLVEDDHGRPADERDRNRDTLLLSAGQLMRKPLPERTGVRQVHLSQCIFDGAPAGVFGAMRPEHRGDLVADADRGIQCRCRLLRHVRDEPAAEAPQRALGMLGQQLAGDVYHAACAPDPRPLVAEQRQRRRCLSAARFAHEPENLPTLDCEGHVLHDGLTRHELESQVLNPQDGIAHRTIRARSVDCPRPRAYASATRLTAIVSAAISRMGTTEGQA